MKPIFTTAALASLALGGCSTTVPSFHFVGEEPRAATSAERSRLTVADIRDHIYCELKNAHMPDHEFITVALTLQVDDAFDVTPAFSYTRLLHAPRVSAVTSLSGDLGRARKRLFTAIYTLNSTLMNAPGAGAWAPQADSPKVLCGWLPHCKGDVSIGWRSDAVLCSTCSRGHGPLALMVSADEVPFCFAGSEPWTLGGLSSSPVGPVRHHFTSSSQLL